MFAICSMSCFQSKNRSTDLLPTDSHRVFLSPGSEDEGSDYINASWLTGDEDDGSNALSLKNIRKIESRKMTHKVFGVVVGFAKSDKSIGAEN